MSKLKSKTLVLSLSIILLLLPIFSCGGAGGGSAETTAAATAEGEPGSPSETDTEGDSNVKLSPNLGDANFEQYEFTILARGPEQEENWQVLKNFFAPEENSEPFNDAVYRRNTYVEEKYNVKIVPTGSNATSEGVQYMTNLVLSGDTTYDVFVPSLGRLGGLVTAGVLASADSIPNLDLEKPWWNQYAHNDLSIANKLYGLVGDIAISTANAARIVLFNKDLIADYGLESPYNLINQNKWTFNTLYEYSKGAYSDLNGNDRYDASDLYGMHVQSSNIATLFYASGEDATKKNANDIPELVIDKSERAAEVYYRIADLLSVKDGVFAGDSATGKAGFPEGRIMFLFEVLRLAEYFRADDVNFGIVPTPKFDENQERYYAWSDSYCMSVVCVPKNNPDLARTGFILEAMAAESKYTLVPAFYEKNLYGKFFRDTDSIATLDLIRESTIIAINEVFGWGIMPLISNPALKNFTSSIEKVADSANKKIDELVEIVTSE